MRISLKGDDPRIGCNGHSLSLWLMVDSGLRLPPGMRVPPKWIFPSGGRVPPSLRESSQDLSARHENLTSVADWVRTTKDRPSGLLDRYGTSRYSLSSGLGSGSGRCVQCPKSKREIWSWCYRCANRGLGDHRIAGGNGRDVRDYRGLSRLEGNSRSRANGRCVWSNGWCGRESGSTNEVIWGYSVGRGCVSTFFCSITILHQVWWTPNDVLSIEGIIG
jgi:hypothetical protein